MRSLGKKPHFWPSQRLKKVFLTTQGCARLGTGPIIMQLPRGYHKKKLLCGKARYVRPLEKKTKILAFPEAKKGVVNYARLRKAAHWPNNNANPSGLSEKKSLLCGKARYVPLLGKKTPFLAFPEAKKGVVNYARLRKAAHWPNNNANPSGLSEKNSLLCGMARYVRPLGEKPHFWPSQRLKKVLLTTQGCARLRTGPIIMQFPRGYHKKKFIVWKGAIFSTLREKTQILAFPEAKKGVVNYARLRKAGHWPNNNANPSGLSEKNSLLCGKARYVRPLGKKPHFWPSQRLKKVLLTTQCCARLRTGPIIMQIPRGYQKKKVYCVERRNLCDPIKKKPHLLPSQRLKKVLLTTQCCARLRTGPIIMQIPRGYQKKKVYCVERRNLCDP